MIYLLLYNLHDCTFDKKHACRELLSFLFIKKNLEYSQTERVKIRFQEINLVTNIYEVETLFSTYGVSCIVMLLWR